MSGSFAGAGDTAAPLPISYAEFGHNFVRQVVSASRLRGEIEGLLKATIEGSIRRLPADLMVASYAFRLRDVQVEPQLSQLPQVRFDLDLTGDMTLDLRLLNIPFRFDIEVRVRIDLHVETYAPLLLKLAPQPVTGRSVELRFDSRNLPGGVLHRLQLLEPVVREQIVRQANRRIGGAALKKAATIDILKLARSARVDGRPEPPAG